MTTMQRAPASPPSRFGAGVTRGPKAALAGLLAAVLTGTIPDAARAEGFDWKRYDGQTINLVLTDHPWSNAIREMAQPFTVKTGIKLRIAILNEDPQRARLNTLLQAKSSDVDVYVSLKIREGAVYNKAGWYADVTPMLTDPSQTAPVFELDDFGAGLIRNETFGGKLTGLPINVEGRCSTGARISSPSAASRYPNTSRTSWARRARSRPAIRRSMPGPLAAYATPCHTRWPPSCSTAAVASSRWTEPSPACAGRNRSRG